MQSLSENRYLSKENIIHTHILKVKLGLQYYFLEHCRGEISRESDTQTKHTYSLPCLSFPIALAKKFIMFGLEKILHPGQKNFAAI